MIRAKVLAGAVMSGLMLMSAMGCQQAPPPAPTVVVEHTNDGHDRDRQQQAQREQAQRDQVQRDQAQRDQAQRDQDHRNPPPPPPRPQQ